MSKHFLFPLSFLFFSCENPFHTDLTDDEDLFQLKFDYTQKRIVRATPVTISWSEITIEHFKEYLIERAVVDDQGVHWGFIDRVTDSLAVSYTDTIDDDVSYQYRVRIVNKSNQFRHTLSETFTVPEVTRINIPQDYSDPQDAYNTLFIDSGDSLLVGAGTYIGNYDFKDKRIVIIAPDGPKRTTLVALQNKVLAEVGLHAFSAPSAVEMKDGHIDGFTITGGGAFYGGGIKAIGNSRIINCIITNNKIVRHPLRNPEPFGRGGGIYADGSILIKDCTVSNNRGTGAIYIDDSATIDHCLISNNFGSGILARNAIIINTRIHKNRPAGIYTMGERAVIRNCIISGTEPIQTNLGAISIGSRETVISNVVFVKNGGILGGTTLRSFSGTNTLVVNSVFYGNKILPTDTRIAGVIDRPLFSFQGNVEILNSIIWNNTGEIELKFLSKIASYSNIEGLTPVLINNNMDRAPRFVNPNGGDFHLRPNSPCIDAGHPGSEYMDKDGSRNDMGAYGGPYGE